MDLLWEDAVLSISHHKLKETGMTKALLLLIQGALIPVLKLLPGKNRLL